MMILKLEFGPDPTPPTPLFQGAPVRLFRPVGRASKISRSARDILPSGTKISRAHQVILARTKISRLDQAKISWSKLSYLAKSPDPRRKTCVLQIAFSAPPPGIRRPNQQRWQPAKCVGTRAPVLGSWYATASDAAARETPRHHDQGTAISVWQAGLRELKLGSNHEIERGS